MSSAINAPTLMLLPVTDAEGIAHLVTEDAMVVGRFFGRYVACCEGEVLAGSLTIPESGSCRACRRWRVWWSR